MDIVIDASALLAVLLNEPERERIIAATRGVGLSAPASLEYEIGNALSSVLKRKSLSVAECVAVHQATVQVPIRFLKPDLQAAIIVSGEEGIYAYDAYYIVCAERLGLPLLSLDKPLIKVARKRGVQMVEAVCW